MHTIFSVVPPLDKIDYIFNYVENRGRPRSVTKKKSCLFPLDLTNALEIFIKGVLRKEAWGTGHTSATPISKSIPGMYVLFHLWCRYGMSGSIDPSEMYSDRVRLNMNP